MADSGKSRQQAAIPSWQLPQQQTTSETPPSSQSNQPNDASVKATANTIKETPNSSATDGSTVSAKQEFDASKAIPENLKDKSTNLATNSPSNLAADQEPAAAVESDQSQSAIDSRSGSTSLDQVRKFLIDPQVKDAPVEQKRRFLESKGIQRDIINSVLEEDASFTALNPADFRKSLSEPVPRDLPPIVTYPEFLVQPQKPPPLVTLNRLLNTAYITGGLAATIYGLSKFIISPLSETLTEARHDFASHASSHLTNLNDKMSGLVSTIPVSTKTGTGDQPSSDFDDLESTASDPTELFHRDIGTQTSPPASPGDDSVSSSVTLSDSEAAISKQEARLKIIHSHMSEMMAGCDSNTSTIGDVQTGVSDFRHYLDNMLYSPPAYQYNSGDTVFTPPGIQKDDPIATLKAEIRSVKGVLLSAKRFPPAAAIR